MKLVRWDEKVTGLHLREGANGRTAWYLYYRTAHGTQRRPKLGDAAVMNVTAARALAKDWLLRVAAGEDPSLDRQGLRAEMTVRQLFARVLFAHWRKPRFRASGYAREVRNLYHTYFDRRFGGMKISELTAGKLKTWHDSMASKPYAANRALAVLSRIYSWAEEMELRDQGTNPCSLVKHHKEAARDRYAVDEEIGRVGEILLRDSEAYPEEIAFLYLLIFTGSRPSGIERARREDLKRLPDGSGLLTIQGKSGLEKIYIPPQAMRVLDRLPSDRPNLVRSFPRTYWERIREEAGCGDLWARDWRRTFATNALSDGRDGAVIGELLNHKDAATTKIYAKLKDDTRHAVAAATARKLETLLSGATC